MGGGGGGLGNAIVLESHRRKLQYENSDFIFQIPKWAPSIIEEALNGFP